MIQKPINVNSTDETIYLDAGKCNIDLLGGFGVDLGTFSIELKNLETEKITKCEEVFWKYQSFTHGKRAKRIFTIEVPESGRYVVIFINSETLVIKHSNLFFSSMFANPLSNEDLECCFY